MTLLAAQALAAGPAWVRDALRDDIAGATASAEIDGVPVTDTSDYLVESPAFALTLGEDNVLNFPAGVYAPAVAGGIHLLVAPLSRGSHHIHFRGCLSSGLGVEATYWLTVGKP